MKAAIIQVSSPHFFQSIDEIVELAQAANYDTSVKFHVTIDKPHPRHYLSEHKIDQLKLLIEENPVIKRVIFGTRLRPHQAFLLEEKLEVDVIDKPMLILEIFEKKANSKDIKMQVRLAQLKYSIPRMVTEMGEAVRSERPGFGGSGEQVTDILVSDMTKRIKNLESKLERYKDEYKEKFESDIPRLPIVGYYSAGKSTLFNMLTDNKRQVGQEAFTTMVLKTSRSTVAGYPIDLIDTVGLVDLPPDILSAFDVMLTSIFSLSGMVLCLNTDVPFEHWKAQLQDFKEYIHQFTKGIPPRIIIVLTKIDLIDEMKLEKLVDYVHKQEWLDKYVVMKSSQENPDEVKEDFIGSFETLFSDYLTEFHYTHLHPSLASKIHDIARIDDQEWHEDGKTSLTGIGPSSLLDEYKGEIFK